MWAWGASSNNTNKLSPQEHPSCNVLVTSCSNNTNKLSPQEPDKPRLNRKKVQIIQINLALKNTLQYSLVAFRFK